MTEIMAAYNQLIAHGELRPDPAQYEALAALQQLATALAQPVALPATKPFSLFRRQPAAVPRVGGVYLYGAVGRGKSMLMDLFFNHVPITSKRRVHFHAFMQEVHGALHHAKQHHQRDDTILTLAETIAAQSRLLCFDEFYVTDIADAMILARLFTALFAAGVVLVATSNTAPDDLYRDGLQRAQFLPFIVTLKAHVDIVRLDGAVDHRLEYLAGQQSYFTPLSHKNTQHLTTIFAHLANHTPAVPDSFIVNQRVLTLQHTGHGVLFSNFAELCGQALGAADYLAIAQRYRTILLDDVPQLQPEQRNETLRLITLIDALYEAKTKLVMVAQAAPDLLVSGGHYAQTFARTASRLHEMQSAHYLGS